MRVRSCVSSQLFAFRFNFYLGNAPKSLQLLLGQHSKSLRLLLGQHPKPLLNQGHLVAILAITLVENQRNPSQENKHFYLRQVTLFLISSRALSQHDISNYCFLFL